MAQGSDFESKVIFLLHSQDSSIWISGTTGNLVSSRLNAQSQTNWAINDQGKTRLSLWWTNIFAHLIPGRTSIKFGRFQNYIFHSSCGTDSCICNDINTFSFCFSRWEDPAGAEIPNDGRIKAVDHRLIVSNAQESDSGNYSCVAENMAGRQVGKVWLVVSGKGIKTFLYWSFSERLWQFQIISNGDTTVKHWPMDTESAIVWACIYNCWKLHYMCVSVCKCFRCFVV